MTKTFTIANTTLDNRYVLAPMAGFTDHSTRKICSEYGAGLTYTEMESCESLYYKSKITIKDLEDTHLDKQEGRKLALQIFGGKQEIVLASIPLFEQYGNYDFLDFNCGCPVPKVIRQHCGSYWLKRPDELLSLLKDMVKTSSKPVIIKIRLGFESVMNNIVPFCKAIQNTGVQAIAIHGRCRSEFFSGPVHYDIIRDIKNNLSIPVIANGEITQNNFQEVLQQTGADAVMIGQHAMGYPKIFQDMIRTEENNTPLETTLKGQLIDLKKHIDYIFQDKDEHQAAALMRSFSVKYLRGFDNVRKARNALVQCNTKEDYLRIIQDIETTL